MTKVRKRRVRFFGGILDGETRDMGLDSSGQLPMEVSVPVVTLPATALTSESNEVSSYVHNRTDTYRLEIWTDGTLIPEKVYRLRAMKR